MALQHKLIIASLATALAAGAAVAADTAKSPPAQPGQTIVAQANQGMNPAPAPADHTKKKKKGKHHAKNDTSQKGTGTKY
jgi:hypothetical protein